MITTISLPAFSGRAATWSAAQIAAPDEMPTSRPSSRAARRAMSNASAFSTVMISSMMSVSRMAGTKPAPMPWIGWGPFWPPDRTGEAAGSTATTLTDGLRCFQHLADARDGSSGADSGDDDVDLAIGVAPDLLGGGGAVDRRVGRVLELLRDEVPQVTLGQFLGLGDGAGHALGPRREDELGPVGPQQRPPLLAHRLGHRESALVAAGGAHHRQRDPGVATGGLEDDRVRPDQPGLLGRIDHCDPDAVLHAVSRVEELELGHDLRPALPGQPTQPHQGCVPDELSDVFRDLHGRHAFLEFRRTNRH